MLSKTFSIFRMTNGKSQMENGKSFFVMPPRPALTKSEPNMLYRRVLDAIGASIARVVHMSVEFY